MTRRKLAVVGDAGVGKTSLIHCQLKDPSPSVSTVGLSVMQLTDSSTGREIILDITDTAGEERYRSLLPIYLRDANFVLLIFDQASRPSFENIAEWDKFVRDAVSTTRVLVANKCDLPQAVQASEIQALLERLQIDTFFQTSAASGSGVDALFMWIFQKLADGEEPRPTTAWAREEAKGPQTGEAPLRCAGCK